MLSLIDIEKNFTPQKEMVLGLPSGFRLYPTSFSVTEGEFFSLLGPSGCGKTTLLRIIGGFENPTAGRILLDNQELIGVPPNKRNIHTVFQKYALFPHLNVFENVAFSLRLKKTLYSEIVKKVDFFLELVEIANLKHRKIQELSGGQAQRVAMARALVSYPKILLLDEPLSALDPQLRIRMREELKNLCKKIGITFIMVTHDQEEALQMSDRIAVMKEGRCLQVGTPKTIYEDPCDPFVAEFIGPVNQIPSQAIEELGENLLMLQSDLGYFKAKKNSVHHSEQKEYSLIIRPEKIRILRAKSTNSENLVTAEIQELSYLGSRTEYTVKAGDKIFRVFEPELERQKKRGLNPGDRIYLTWKPEDVILLSEQQQ